MMNRLACFLPMFAFLVLTMPGVGRSADVGVLHPLQLRCEYLVNPRGIDQRQPRLSWRVGSDERDQRQTAYRVLVASDDSLLAGDEADLWDSGRVESDATTHIVYEGRPLASRQQCYWKVCVWDRQGRDSAWSEPACWSVGLLRKEDWAAEWISFRDDSPLDASQQKIVLPPARYYRREFKTKQPVRRATVYASALGILDLVCNGRRINDAMFAPGWCDYAKRAFYVTLDVTDAVRRGDNVIGAVVADGWYAGYVGYGLLVGYGPNRCGRYFYGKTPALRLQLEIEYTDGSRDTILTDGRWKVGTGGYLEADMLMGEAFDARREPDGWSSPGFDDAGWPTAIGARENGSTKATFFDQGGERSVELGFQSPPVMQAYPSVPIRVTQQLRPRKITDLGEGRFMVDFGQNFAGVVRLRARGQAGTRIVLRHGEMLHPDGRLMTENLRRARASDTFVLSGDPDGEVYEPRFTYHGFQFVEVSGYPGQLTADDITGLVLHSDTPMVSQFECSDPVLNRFFQNVVWTQRANFIEIPTDCPQRDERLGWMGDAQIYARTATVNADVGAFFTKWIEDVREAQTPAGAYPDYCPYPMQHGGSGKPYAAGWMDAGVICPWTMYQAYGDRRILRRHYDSMQRFLEFRKSLSPDLLGTKPGNGWGDWLAVGETTPIEYVDHVYFAHTADLMARIATVLGEQADATEYGQLSDRIRDTFVKRYVREDGTLAVDTQTAYALAIRMDLMPDSLKDAAGARLAAKIRENDNRMTTGFLGTRPLLPALTETGHFELAAQMLQSRRFPSWGYEVVNGATSVWERWNSYTKDEGFMNPSMNSFSHYSFGAVCEWMFGTLAGIESDGPAFHHVLIRPHVPMHTPLDAGTPPLTWVRARYDSIRGPIEVHWRRDAGVFQLDVEIPANTTATVILPAADAGSVRVDGQCAQEHADISSASFQDGIATFQIPSGRYAIKAALEPAPED